MRDPNTTYDQRLSLIIETQRELSEADGDLQTVMHLIADRSQAIIGADGAMVNLVEGDHLHTRAACGVASRALGWHRPIAGSIPEIAIETRKSVLIEDCPSDPRMDQGMFALVRDQSLICVPLFRGHDAIATLNVMTSSETGRLTERDRKTLELMSMVLSEVISRACELEARRAEADAVNQFRTLFDSASIGIVRLNGEGVVLEANPELERMFGVEIAGLEGSRFSEYVVGSDRGSFEAMLSGLSGEESSSLPVELCCQSGAGAQVWTLLRAVLEPGSGGMQDTVTAMIENITERKRAEHELIRQAELNEHQALHDPLTGLPNRVLFSERIGQAVREAQRHGKRIAVALVDLDRFKEVNDSLGHTAGDHLLIEVGERMAAAVRASDTVARLGGDEFGLVLPELDAADDILPVLDRLQHALEDPIHVQGLPLAIEASIGIAIYPDHGGDVQTLIQRADVAMYDAKRDGCTYMYYDDSTHDYDVSRLTLVGELRRAISERELVLYYQPKAALDDGRVRSAEALLRWMHPERGVIYPDAFIPIAQETSLIGPLTLYVIEEALRQSSTWQKQGVELSIAVNLSTRNLLDRDFPRQVSELLHRWDVAPQWLELEVTESSMLANPTRAKAVLGELSELGIRLSIDDFGTGYSSLAYLRQLPVDEIKIDRSFVLGMAAESGDAVIVRSTVDLGRNLGLEVVAEGVETVEHWQQLRELGCDTAQGFFLSRPMPATEFSSWILERPAPAETPAH